VTRPYLSIVVPTYNEARAIGGALDAMRHYLDRQTYAYEVIVASDGDDSTPDIVLERARDWPQLRLSAERRRCGKGHGLRRGFAMANGEIVGFLDGDYKTPIEEMEKLLPWLSQGIDLVVGSRALADSRIEVQAPWFRRVGSHVFAVGLRALIGLPHVHDTQCGFKFFTAQAAHDIFGNARVDGYMVDIEILWLAQRLGLKVKEVGVVWTDDADSRLDLVRGNIRNCIELLQIRFTNYPRVVAEVPPQIVEARRHEI
jgi:dolichyl-phosphate beta-glucosyltransferase